MCTTIWNILTLPDPANFLTLPNRAWPLAFHDLFQGWAKGSSRGRNHQASRRLEEISQGNCKYKKAETRANFKSFRCSLTEKLRCFWILLTKVENKLKQVENLLERKHYVKPLFSLDYVEYNLTQEFFRIMDGTLFRINSYHLLY